MKRKPIRKSKKSERTKAIEANDDILREIVRLRDNYTCQKTRFKGDKYTIDVAHFYSREYKRVRWDLDNVCCLRKGTHSYWAHKKFQEFSEWWEERIGSEKFERLKLKARVRGTIYTSEIKLLKLDLLNKLDYYKKRAGV